MYVGPVKTEQALGALLVHTLRIGKMVFKKGQILQAQDLIELQNHQIPTVTVARLQEGDISEDQAALRIAQTFATETLKLTDPFTGRVNLFSRIKGLMILDSASIERVNAVDEAVTIATKPNATVVDVNEMVATIKIIPFSVSQETLARIEGLSAQREKAIQIFPFITTRVGLIQTRQPDFKDSVLDKTSAITHQRLTALGAEMITEKRCHHDTASVIGTFQEILDQELDLILMIGSSAIADRRDVIPAALTAQSGRIIHFGMPVDPGNLILIGASSQGIPVVGLPGCARSPKRNGFDWILERLIARLPVTPEVVMGMGVGGLLDSTPTTLRVPEPQPSRVGAILLAAGESRRMGQINKLLSPIEGEPMVVRTFQNILESKADPIVIVLGYQAQEIQQALEDSLKRAQTQGRTILTTTNPSFQEGIGSSAGWGMRHLPEGSAGVLICLGDMPWVSGAIMDRLIDHFNPQAGSALCVPTVGEKRGNPILWGAQFFNQLLALQEDRGGRDLLLHYEKEICRVQSDPRVLIDIDSPENLALFS